MSRVLKDSRVEWIGKIPENWDCLPLRFITEQINEKNNPIKFSNILSLTNTRGVVPYEEKGNQGNISKEDLTEYKIAYKNTVIINSMNLKIGSVGLSSFDGCVSPVYYVLKNKGNSDIRYINYLFQSPYQKWLGRFGKGILEIREKIGMYDVLHSYIPVPPLVEQQKIADYLDKKCSKIDEQKENYEKSIELLKEYKQSLITEAVTKGLNKNVEMKDSGIDWIGIIPNNRGLSKIKYIFNYIGGFAFNSEKFVIEGELKNQVLRIGNVKNDCIVLDNNPVFINDDYIQPQVEVKEGQILFTMTGTRGKKDYFFTVLIEKDLLQDKRLYINQRVGAFEKKGDVDMKYYSYLLKTDLIRDYAFLSETGTANQANLGINDINDITVLYPPLSEQKQIADYLDKECSKIDKVIAYREQMIEKLDEYKKSLIYECVTGKKEIK